MDEAIIWFAWEGDEPLEPWKVNEAVLEGGMAVTQFQILDSFTFTSGVAKAASGLELEFKGKAPEDGEWAIEIYDYEEEDFVVKVQAVRPYFKPRLFNPTK
ncbi:MAG: hypothetical protein ACYTDT_00795 [Planctomycetota bacterium]